MIAISERWRCINCPNWLYKYPAATVMHVMLWLVRRYVLSCSWTRKKVVLWTVSSNSTTQGLLKGRLLRGHPMNDGSPPHGLGMSLGMVEVKCFVLGWRALWLFGLLLYQGLLYYFLCHIQMIYYIHELYIHQIVIEMKMSFLSNQEGWYAMVGWWNHGMRYGVGILIFLIMKLHRWKDLYHDFVTCSLIAHNFVFYFVLYIIYRPIVRKQWVVDLYCGCMVED